MRITSTNYGHYFDEIRHDYPAEFYDKTGYSETHTRLLDDVSQGELGEICFQGVRIHYGRFHTLKTDTIHTTEDFPSVKMSFQLQGQSSQRASISMAFADQQHNLSYQLYTDVRSQFGIGDHHYVGIQLTETFFSRFADEASPGMNRILTSMAQRNPTILTKHNLPVTPALRVQLVRLTNPNRSQPLRRLYLETTVLDLLYEQLEQADGHLAQAATTLKTGDLDKLLVIKALLDSNPLGVYSLVQLSRYVGLNDYKLKKGFRELVGTTVFGYLNDVRMRYAHQLLRDTNQPIGEIASTLGYSETHHFSAAFNRKFGYLPSQVRSS